MTAETKWQPISVESMSPRRTILYITCCLLGFWVFSQIHPSTLKKKVKILPSREIMFCLDLTSNPGQGVNLIHFIVQVFLMESKLGKFTCLVVLSPFI